MEGDGAEREGKGGQRKGERGIRYLCVMVEDLLSMLATNAAELVAAERHSCIKLVPRVHPHSAGLQSSARTHTCTNSSVNICSTH